MKRIDAPLLFVFISFSVLVPACTFQLSNQTDEEAWMDFQRGEKLLRRPAMAGPEKNPTLQSLLGQVSLRNILLSCFKNEQLQACFQEKLAAAFDENYKKSPTQNEFIERTRFLNENSFSFVFDQVQGFHQRLFSGMDLKASEQMRKRIQQCAQQSQGKSAGTEETSNFSFYNGGVTEVPKGELICLNQSWDWDSDRLIEETASQLRLNVKGQNAKEWIKKYQISPLYQQEVAQFFAQAREENLNAWTQALPELKKEFSETIKKNKTSLNQFVAENSRKYRPKYPYLPLEPLLTHIFLTSP